MSGDRDLRRALGRLDFLPEHETMPARDPFTWLAPSAGDAAVELHERVVVAEDHEQPASVAICVLFEPDPEGIYDVEWIVDAPSDVQAGETLARCYRVSDGLPFEQRAPVRLRVLERCVRRNDRVVRGDALVRCAIPSVALDMAPFRALAFDLLLDFSQAVNAAFKGCMGALGQGGQIASTVTPVQVELHPERGEDELIGEIVDALSAARLADGDVVVASERLFSIAQGRLFPLDLLQQFDPKTTDREGRADLAALVRRWVPDVTPEDLLCADSLASWPGGPMATAGVRDPNGVAHRLTLAIEARLGVRCDAVVSDTDTGTEVRETLIGCVTVGATPLGATAGLVIYECMRVASAAELCRGSSRGIPIVVCRPHQRRMARGGVGRHRGYEGRLDVARERLVGFA